jgi:aspartyl-tRNA(Asn)/glutamyl-tRNA(Gln) amidotransferase subunit B
VRLVEQLQIAPREAESILARREFGDFFDAMMAAGLSAASASNWFRGEVLRHLNELELNLDDYPLTAESIAAVVKSVEEDRISVAKGREILQQSIADGRSPTEILAGTSEQVSDESTLMAWVQGVLESHPDAVDKIRAGDARLMGFLTGQVMQASKGAANPRKVQQILQRLIQQS